MISYLLFLVEFSRIKAKFNKQRLDDLYKGEIFIDLNSVSKRTRKYFLFIHNLYLHDSYIENHKLIIKSYPSNLLKLNSANYQYYKQSKVSKLSKDIEIEEVLYDNKRNVISVDFINKKKIF